MTYKNSLLMSEEHENEDGTKEFITYDEIGKYWTEHVMELTSGIKYVTTYSEGQIPLQRLEYDTEGDLKKNEVKSANTILSLLRMCSHFVCIWMENEM